LVFTPQRGADSRGRILSFYRNCTWKKGLHPFRKQQMVLLKEEIERLLQKKFYPVKINSGPLANDEYYLQIKGAS
jgi:hypothetical protein